MPAHRAAMARAVVGVVRDVVVVVVRAEHVRHGHRQLVDAPRDRGERPAGVDHDRVAAGPVRHEPGVGQPASVHRPVDDHGSSSRASAIGTPKLLPAKPCRIAKLTPITVPSGPNSGPPEPPLVVSAS